MDCRSYLMCCWSQQHDWIDRVCCSGYSQRNVGPLCPCSSGRACCQAGEAAGTFFGQQEGASLSALGCISTVVCSWSWQREFCS